MANFETNEGERRSDKEAIRTTKTVGNSSQHRIVFPVMAKDHSVQIAFNIPKDSFVELQFSDIEIEEFDEAEETATEKFQEGRRPNRLYALAGTENIELVNKNQIRSYFFYLQQKYTHL